MKKSFVRGACALGVALALAGCAETPMGPRVQMIPPPGKSYEQFMAEKQQCQTYAENDVHGQAEHENHRALIGALVTTAAGAALGGAIGGGGGAGIGAASGALGGGLGGAGYSGGQESGIQLQYDQTYTACMVSRGNKMPANAVIVQPNGMGPSAYAQ